MKKMREATATLLMFILMTVLSAQEKTAQQGYQEGRMAASRESQMSWLLIASGTSTFLGCTGGCVTPTPLFATIAAAGGGLVGGGAVACLGYSSGGHPPFTPEGPNEYRSAYLDGYNSVIKSKKGGNAIGGTIVGTLLATGTTVVLWALAFSLLYE